MIKKARTKKYLINIDKKKQDLDLFLMIRKQISNQQPLKQLMTFIIMLYYLLYDLK